MLYDLYLQYRYKHRFYVTGRRFPVIIATVYNVMTRFSLYPSRRGYINGICTSVFRQKFFRKYGQMYCLQNGNDIIGAVALTDQNSSYHGINWSINLPVEDVLVVHVLAVHPYFQQQGTARKIMQDVIAYAENTRKKAIRPDALAGNLPAHHLYESLGFIKCDTRNRYAENTGFTDFYLFEMIL